MLFHANRSTRNIKECHKNLDSTNLTEKDNEVYCKSCYGKRFGPKGYGYAGGAAFLNTEGPNGSVVTTGIGSGENRVHGSYGNLGSATSLGSNSNLGSGAPKCPRCTTTVYPAEMIVGPNGSYHKSCFTCKVSLQLALVVQLLFVI